MSTQTLNYTTDDLQRLVNQHAWRLFPHSFYETVTEGIYKPYAYQKLIGYAIAEALAAGNGRLLVNAPTRHGKSETVSIATPTWFIETFPNKRVILCSYGQDLAVDPGRVVRNNFEKNPYLEVKLRQDSKAASMWNTAEGGGMITAGVNGPIVGKGGDLLLLDDPYKNWQQAHSALYRRNLRNWFDSTFFTRREPGATVIVVMHRWHEEDLTAELLTDHPDKWTLLRFPAICEEQDVDSDLLKRRIGEALAPERYSAADLEVARGANRSVWNSMYQQRPDENAAGKVYYHFKRALTSPEPWPYTPDPRLPLQVYFDFNVTPGMICGIGQYDRAGGNRAADCFYSFDEIPRPFQHRLKTPELIDQLILWLRAHGDAKNRFGHPYFQYPRLEIFGDAAGRKESSITTRTDYWWILTKLRREKIAVRMCVPSKNPPVRTRVMAVNEALLDGANRCHWQIDPVKCPRLLIDLKEVVEDENGEIDKDDKDLTHPSDAAGYWIRYQRPVEDSIQAGGHVHVPLPTSQQQPEPPPSERPHPTQQGIPGTAITYQPIIGVGGGSLPPRPHGASRARVGQKRGIIVVGRNKYARGP